MSERSGRVVRRAISIATTVALVAAIVIAALMVVPTLLGFERYVIVSGSMAPTIPVGSVVYDEVVPVDDLEVGDIITFVPPPEFGVTDPVTHRIVQITVADDSGTFPGAKIFRTEGDANDTIDPWKMVLDGPDQARVVHHIPYVGYFYMLLRVPWVQFLVVAVPAFALIAYITVSLWRLSGEGVRQERARRREQDHQDVAT